MAIQNPGNYRPGGTASALGLNTATLIKSSGGTFWNINVNQYGSNVGYLCDSATIAGASPANAILTIPAAPSPSSSSTAPQVLVDLPGAGPFPFLNGLVFLPGSADLNVNVSYA
jgi:hypothetical protein